MIKTLLSIGSAALLAAALAMPAIAEEVVGGWRTVGDCGNGPDRIISFVIIESASKSRVSGYINEPERKITGGSFNGKSGKFSMRYNMPTGGVYKQEWTFTVSQDTISGRSTANGNYGNCTYSGRRLLPMN